MERLDQFFNDKMGPREIPFNEEHWKMAEQLLDQKKKKRRFGFWLWWGVGALVCTAAICAIWLWPNGTTTQIDQFLIPTHKGLQQATIDIPNNNTINNQAEEINQQDPIAIFKDPKNTNNTVVLNEKISNNKHRQIPLSNTTQTNTTVSLDEEEGIVFIKDEPDNTQNEKIEFKAIEEKIVIQEQTKKEEGLNRILIPIALLEYPLRDYNKRALIKVEEKPMIETAFEAWSWGLSANAMLYPYRSADNETWIGWNAGMFTTYHFSPSFGLQAGLQYRLRTGQFGFSKESQNTSYRFGREEQRFLLLPNQLYYLEVPLILQYSNAKHQLGLGVRLQYLLGVRGSLRNSFDVDSEPNLLNTNKLDQAWIVKDGFREWPIDLMTSYFYGITKRWQIGLEASYTIGGITDQDYERPFPIIYEESLSISLNVGLRFLID